MKDITSKGIVSTETEIRLRINGARLRREHLITTRRRDQMRLAESYRALTGAKPPTDEQLRAAGVVLPQARVVTTSRRREPRA